MIHDVAVVGGGPAGCATALALRRIGVERVVVVESSDYDSARVGESIPPDTRLLLRQLGVLDSFLAQDHERCLGSCSSWGSAELGHNDFLVNPFGDGWHLDRLRFDRWIAEQTERSEVEIRRRTIFRDLERGGGRRPIELRLTGPGGGPSTVRCRFVVDATGQQARVARRLGARPRSEDQLVCVAGYLDAAPGHGLSSLTMLEAVEYGWWYAARLPDGRLTAAVASDPAIVREMGLTRAASWSAELVRTRHVGPALAGCPLVESRLHVWSAPSTLLDPPAGAGWAAVGDAASAFDPISSQGIHKALADGLRAAPAIVAWLDGDGRPLTEYRNGIAERFLDYLAMRSHFYGIERRWEDAPFWRRRRAVHPGERREPAGAHGA